MRNFISFIKLETHFLVSLFFRFGGKKTVLNIYMYVKLLKLYTILCDPIDYSPPGFSVHGILQAEILEWVAISSSNIHV